MRAAWSQQEAAVGSRSPVTLRPVRGGFRFGGRWVVAYASPRSIPPGCIPPGTSCPARGLASGSDLGAPAGEGRGPKGQGALLGLRGGGLGDCFAASALIPLIGASATFPGLTGLEERRSASAPAGQAGGETRDRPEFSSDVMLLFILPCLGYFLNR